MKNLDKANEDDFLTAVKIAESVLEWIEKKMLKEQPPLDPQSTISE